MGASEAMPFGTLGDRAGNSGTALSAFSPAKTGTATVLQSARHVTASHHAR
jgi:hypothetical protein